MPKAWSWSFSKLKNFETCEYRHQQVDLLKNYTEVKEVGGPLDWGNAVHEALKQALVNGTALPEGMEEYKKWVDRVKAGPGELLVEQQYAITQGLEKTAYFANNAWYRAKGDAVRIWDKLGLVVDWKTGKMKEDSVQLVLMAQCLFSHYPALTHVRSNFIWLQDDCATGDVFTRQDIANNWIGLLDRVHTMENAFKTNTYHKKPGRLCRSWCPVKNCEHHGKSHG